MALAAVTTVAREVTLGPSQCLGLSVTVFMGGMTRHGHFNVPVVAVRLAANRSSGRGREGLGKCSMHETQEERRNSGQLHGVDLASG